jgi:PAS domain-containing protein
MSRSQSFPDTEAPPISFSPQHPDSAREASISVQRATLLYHALPAALVASGGCALALVLVNWTILPHGGLLAWLGYQGLVGAGRYWLARSFMAIPPTVATIRHWDRAFVVGTTLAGVGWGASALLLFPDSSPAHQVFLAFVLGGVTAGAASTLAARFDAYLAFAVPTLAPLVFRLFTLGHEQAFAMATCTMLFILLLTYTTFRMSRTISETLQLKYHNAQLVEQLTSQLEEGEQTELLLNVTSEHYRFIMDYAQDIIYRTDERGNFNFINPAVIRLLGHHETDMLGHSALDFVHPHYRRRTAHF